jgi:L-galactose dehydrogenase
VDRLSRAWFSRNRHIINFELMKYRPLGKTGLNVSILGFGASSMGDVFGKRDPEVGKQAVAAAIAGGVNYFDVAPLYGLTLSEQRLGDALKGRPRDSYVLSTKCGRDNFDSFDYSAKRVRASIDESLKRLGTDYVDVYQIHDIEFGDRQQIIQETLPAAREVQASGKARFIGITGLPVRYLRSVADEIEIDTIMSWGHYTLVEDELVEELEPLAIEREIGILNAAPLMQCLLTEEKIPDWHRGPKQLLAIQPKLIELCRSAGVNLADVAMKHAMDYPHCASTVVSMSSPRRVNANLAALDFEIPDGLLDDIATLIEPVKNVMWFEGRAENNIPPSDPDRWVPQFPETTHS